MDKPKDNRCLIFLSNEVLQNSYQSRQTIFNHNCTDARERQFRNFAFPVFVKTFKS